MWARLDDELIDHRKIIAAAELLGPSGGAIALGLYTIGLLWSNKHLTDGHLPNAVVRTFWQAENPATVADALVKVGLWEKNGSGYQIHDYNEFNFSADKVKAKRRRDRLRKRGERGS